MNESILFEDFQFLNLRNRPNTTGLDRLLGRPLHALELVAVAVLAGGRVADVLHQSPVRLERPLADLAGEVFSPDAILQKHGLKFSRQV